MNQEELYNQVCRDISRTLTYRYSTSFSLGIKLFDKKLRGDICAIYGFVRLADEIVDTFHHVDKKKYLDQIRFDIFDAIQSNYHINPILHAFAQVVNKYSIDHEYITAFLDSMEMDLTYKKFTEAQYKKYIYGSAEVVGLFCLKVFLFEKKKEFDELKSYACVLGSAFQKINFLRDIKDDFEKCQRVYFPEVEFSSFNNDNKKNIEEDIRKEFEFALTGITKLPANCKYGVKLAYQYYFLLFKKITFLDAKDLLEKRNRLGDFRKLAMFISIYIQAKLTFKV